MTNLLRENVFSFRAGQKAFRVHKAQRIVGLETGRFGPEHVAGHARFGDNGMPQEAAS
jgi:hypothetical protein